MAKTIDLINPSADTPTYFGAESVALSGSLGQHCDILERGEAEEIADELYRLP